MDVRSTVVDCIEQYFMNEADDRCVFDVGIIFRRGLSCLVFVEFEMNTLANQVF